MNNYHINLIRANTDESDIYKIEKQLSEIYERTSTVLFDSMIKNWIKMSDEQKIEIALLNCGSKDNLIPFLGLLEGLAGNINDVEE